MRDRHLAGFLERIFREALSSSFGGSFYRIFTFYVDKGLGGNLFEVFLEDPSLVYGRVEELYGFGAVYIFKAVYDHLKTIAEPNLSFEEFLESIKAGEKEKLRCMFKELAEAVTGGYPRIHHKLGGRVDCES